MEESYYYINDFKKAANLFRIALVYHPVKIKFHTILISILIHIFKEYQDASKQIKIAEESGHVNKRGI